MATSSLLLLIDDIATLLDDVAVMTKVAAKKTAGVLGDDLALNAQQVAGVSADRELPVVWAVAKGSMVNKVILVPAALLISTVAPWAIAPLLMLGGLFLCFEGAEKVLHRFLHSPAEDAAHREALSKTLSDPATDVVAYEQTKIKGAIRTDFILSAEIIVITLGTVAAVSFGKQVAVLTVVAVAMTIGVYGLVAAIVKLDDAGLALQARGGRSAHVGAALLALAPRLMRFLSIAGTLAMFLVGGGILVHGIGPVHHWVEAFTQSLSSLATVGPMLALSTSVIADGLVGFAAGALIVGMHVLWTRWRGGTTQ